MLEDPELASTGSLLLVVFHRIAVDLWSILLLLDDLRILMLPNSLQPLDRQVKTSAVPRGVA
jgi:hypothetical protein